MEEDQIRFRDEPPGTGEGFGTSTSPKSEADPGRAQFVQRLDAVDRVATAVYEVLMYLAIAGMTGLAVFFYLVIRDDYWRDFLLIYGGVVYLIGMLWATGQLWWIRRRRAGEPAKSIRSALSQLGSKIARRGLRAVVPQYAAMNGVMKAVLRKAVEAALAARRSA